MNDVSYLRRKQAADYLKTKYGVGASRTLAKLAVVGGGPVMVYFGSVPVYTFEALDTWAQSKISGPRTSTSDRGDAA